MTLAEMRQILQARGIQLTKSLGQNFLHDGNQLRRIAESAALTSEDLVVEVGPGLGPLTEQLLARARRVVAIEKDARLFAVLQERLAQVPHLILVSGDALELARPGAIAEGQGAGVSAFREHILGCPGTAPMPSDEAPGAVPAWKLVSNLPYSVASPLMVDLAWSPFRPARMVVTLQLEVVRRLAAAPRTPDYGALTLLLQLDYEVAGWFKIPAGCFFPAPDVDSGCVSLLRRTTPLLEAKLRRTYWRLVKTGFSQRRKMMLKLLKQNWPTERLQTAFAACGLAATTRAEELDVHAYVALARALAESELSSGSPEPAA